MRLRHLGSVAMLAGCASPPEGLRETPDGDGPVVAIDWDRRPLPELPFPNDLATRADPFSPTGLRLNISEEAPTELERRARRKVNELSGFGIYGAITVAFDARLDLDEIVARQRDGDVTNDAFYVIDVTPGSPTYLAPVELDVGHGRFPMDVAEPDAYFPNDPHVDVPSLVFDTHDEDLDGDGVLDPDEDVDSDGVLDVPNVWPEGGDPRDDLLSWYELQTDTLIFRPVVPMREETRYAVVLTERLVGTDGNPVRSPWPYVNHTRQTDALLPVLDALPDLDAARDDVAFAWTFTTGRVTGDLVDLRRSIDGDGPWAWLPEETPPAITRAHTMHEMPAVPDHKRLPMATVVALLGATGLVDEDAQDVLADGYAFGDAMVGASFRTPFLLADRDDGGGDAVDEWWQVDPVRGTVSYEPIEVAVTCALPKATAEHQPPYPVAIYGHGYGSTRLETFMFAWAFVRSGFAVCTMDFPGHGPDLGPDERAEVVELLEPIGLLPLLDHLEDARYVDTNNDGRKDSGSHQWTADSFHTRDQVRQAVVDWMWLVAALRKCGTGTMEYDGRDIVACDWDEDGNADIGGPDVDFVLAGGSLGGIVNGVAAGVMPDVSAHAPIVAGGGYVDITLRAPTGGAVEAMHGKVMSPMFLGFPQGDGTLLVAQYVNSFMDMNTLPVASVASVPAGGTVVVENLATGEVRESRIPADGSFRIGIPADALDYYEKRVATGMPDDGPVEGEVYAVPGNEGLGDPLRVTLLDADKLPVRVIDTFELDGAMHDGVTFPAGSPLVAAASGYGRARCDPDTRRLIQVVGLATEPGDPIAYAPHWVGDPFEALGGKPTNVLLMPTVGDMVVSVNSEISLARAAGFVERHEVDARYGTTVDEFLIDRRVVHGLEEFGPYTLADGSPALFDADDLDNGTDDYGAPSDAPLRITIPGDAGTSGVRIPYVSPTGSHGFGAPSSSLAFDINMFAVNQISRFLETRGAEISDDPCLEDATCPWIPVAP